VSACGAAGLGGAGAGTGGTPESLRNLPPRHDPPLDLSDDDDLGRARGNYDALPLSDASRGERRRELLAAYRQRIDRLINDSRDEAFARFQTALELWDARELRGDRVPDDIDRVEPIAQTIYKRFSKNGADRESAAALVVLQAAHPERTGEYDKTWNDIAAYTDDLAVAEMGTGAERARTIAILEDVTAHFPSAWATKKLVDLYVARQDMVNKAVNGKNTGVLHAHPDRGMVRPQWNVIRAYARAWKLEDSVPVVDKMAGGFADLPELRKRLHAALEGGGGETWVALAAAYFPDEQRDPGDIGTALAICEMGAEKLPQALEPRKCAAEVGRVTDRVPLAIRWVEAARRIAPDDRDTGDIAARLYLVRIADELQAERVDAARAHMQEIVSFYGEAARRWTEKPLDTKLSDAYLTFGRGLYNLGEIEDAQRELDLAQAQSKTPLPQVMEEKATILFKTGHYLEAAQQYQRAAALPRSTPLETTYDQSRLSRLAGEAWQQAGDKKRAQGLFQRAMQGWKEVLGASVRPGLLPLVYAEEARCSYDLGQADRAVQQLNQALDTDPDQPGIYGDAVAFLVTRGRYADALDAYHRALGRDQVTEYIKVYTSLWMVDAAQIRGVEADRFALDYLAQVEKGGRWFHQLARFKLGKMSFDELLAKADTRGKRAEAYFYEAMNRYAKGDKRGAERLLGDVVSTQMLGFFEYDMANFYLAHGPPNRPR
jgi:tetratricopeptide (TPR) repeat protein